MVITEVDAALFLAAVRSSEVIVLHCAADVHHARDGAWTRS
jgi:hypothetical protein